MFSSAVVVTTVHTARSCVETKSFLAITFCHVDDKTNIDSAAAVMTENLIGEIGRKAEL